MRVVDIPRLMKDDMDLVHFVALADAAAAVAAGNVSLLGQQKILPSMEYLLGFPARSRCPKKFNMPLIGRNIKNTECSSGAKPTFGYLFEISHTVNEVSLGVAFWEVQQVNRARRMDDIHCDIAYLAKPLRPFINAQKFRYGGSGL